MFVTISYPTLCWGICFICCDLLDRCQQAGSCEMFVHECSDKSQVAACIATRALHSGRSSDLKYQYYKLKIAILADIGQSRSNIQCFLINRRVLHKESNKRETSTTFLLLSWQPGNMFDQLAVCNSSRRGSLLTFFFVTLCLWSTLYSLKGTLYCSMAWFCLVHYFKILQWIFSPF